MATYEIEPNKSRLEVLARSKVHDTTTQWTGITGYIEAYPPQLDNVTAEIKVDMRTADAGDWLKNRKLRKDMDFVSHPEASFHVDSVDAHPDNADGSLEATVHGTLSWRGHSVAIEAQGKGTITSTLLKAEGTFELDVTKLGVTPPKILMVKVEDVVTCRVILEAKVSAG